MNYLSLQKFKSEVNKIKEYLVFLQNVNDAVGVEIIESDSAILKKEINKLKEQYRSFSTDKKVFEYKAIIISLYGLLESSIESWVKEYLESITKIIPLYDQVETKLKESHFELSIKLISLISTKDNPKFQHLTKEGILKKLANCISSSSDYFFNTEAFTINSGNLKHSRIVEIFKLLNLDLNKGLLRCKSLNEKIASEHTQIDNLVKDVMYSKINDLVDRRNVIAHGSENVDDLLDTSVLISYIEFMEKYCEGIVEMLEEEITAYESIYKYQMLNKINVWDQSIVGFKMGNNNIKIGDLLIIKTAEDRYIKKEVLEIQIENITYKEAFLNEEINVAVRVSPSIKNNQTFFLIQRGRKG